MKRFFGQFARWALHNIAVATLFILEMVKIVVLAGITIGLIRYFLFKPFYVKGASMEPNFHESEYLIIDELSYRFREPERGEVIVFKHNKEYFLKRIIGLPRETVKVAEGKVTIYNTANPEGVLIQEDYLPSDLITVGERVTVLGEDEYYVLGDNRPNSYDSRRFGPIDRDTMIGRAWFRGWPLSRVQLFKTPEFDF